MHPKHPFLLAVPLLLGVSAAFAQSTCTVDADALLKACDPLESGMICTLTEGSATMGALPADLIAAQPGAQRIAWTFDETPLIGILFGEVTLKNDVQTQTAVVELPMQNIAGYDVNLRAGAGTDFDTVGTLKNKAAAIANGRSADNAWVRISTDDLTAWVSAQFVRLEGDIAALPVLASPFTQPYQAMTLTAEASDCGGGLLLQTADETPLTVAINGAVVTLEQATALVTVADDTLTLSLIGGAASVRADSTTRDLTAGDRATVALNADGQAVEAPAAPELFAFSTIALAPMAALPIQDVGLCLTGAATLADERETRGGPGADYSVVGALDARATYVVEGFAEATDGVRWLRLDNDLWTPAVDEALVGSCATLAEVSAPPLNTEMSVVSNASSVPTVNTRYQAYSGTDVLSGSCEASAPIAVCDHLAVVIPNGDGTISWRGQEPINYLMQAQGGNRFLYSGRNFQNNANLTLDLTFTNGTDWRMTMTTVFDAAPDCNHNFYYTGSTLN